MSSKEDVLAAREAKKLAKQNAKLKAKGETPVSLPKETSILDKVSNETIKTQESKHTKETVSPKSKDEVDRAVVTETKTDITEKTKEQIKAERAAKKLTKQAKKKGIDGGDTGETEVTNKAVAETLKNIVEVAKEVQQVTAKVNALMLKVKPSLLVKVTEALSNKLIQIYNKACSNCFINSKIFDKVEFHKRKICCA